MRWVVLTLVLSGLAMGSAWARPHAAVDPGKQEIGLLSFTVIYGSREARQEVGRPVSERLGAELREHSRLPFAHYFVLGEDEQPLLRSYENWANPLRPSKLILLSFETARRLSAREVEISLKYWQDQKLMLKAHPRLTVGRPLLLLGPPWRNGRLIFRINLLELRP